LLQKKSPSKPIKESEIINAQLPGGLNHSLTKRTYCYAVP